MSSGCISRLSKAFSMHESHPRAPGKAHPLVSGFQSRASPSWLIACHCQEEQLSCVGKRLEFQNDSAISTEDSELFFFTDRCPARCCPTRCYALCPVSSFVFIRASLVLMCPLTGRPLFAEIRELRVPFHAVKRNKFDKYHIHVFRERILTKWMRLESF